MKLKRIPRLIICMLLAISLFASPVFMSGTAAAAETLDGMTQEELAAALRLIEVEQEALAEDEYAALLAEMEPREIDMEEMDPIVYVPQEAEEFPFSNDEQAVPMMMGAFFAEAFNYEPNEDGYIEISTAAMLDGIRNIENWQEKDYVLTDDIDLLDLENPWTPFVEEFTGIFDGGGFVISNLFIGSEVKIIVSNQTGGGGGVPPSKDDLLAGLSETDFSPEFFGSSADENPADDSANADDFSATSADTELLTENIGLFSAIGEGGIVRNLKITGVNINADADNVGALAGTNAGTIENVAIQENVVKGNDYVGGLVGINSGTVDFSSVYAQVVGQSTVGGFMGRNSGDITRSGAVGSVYASAGLNDVSVAGGFVGLQAAGLIENCSAMANPVVGAASTGGFAGQADEGAKISLSHSMSYLPLVVGDPFVEVDGHYSSGISNRMGFVGDDNGGVYNACYYELSGIKPNTVSVENTEPRTYENDRQYFKLINPDGITDIGAGKDYVFGYATNVRWETNSLLSKQKISYEGLDFDQTWDLYIDDNEDDNEDNNYFFYPMIRGLNIYGTIPENPIPISTQDDFKKMTPYTVLVYELTNDIVLDYASWECPDFFEGYFASADGNNYTITMNFGDGRNEYGNIGDYTNAYARLFQQIIRAYVSDITIEGMRVAGNFTDGVALNVTTKDIEAWGEGWFSGMFGSIRDSYVDNCHVQNVTLNHTGTSSANAADFAAGIHSSKVYNCTVSDVSILLPINSSARSDTSVRGDANGFVNAITGDADAPSEVVNCHVYGGELSGASGGGFVGSIELFHAGKIENCTTNANIQGLYQVGGFISGTMTRTDNSYNSAAIPEIINCGATGKVSGAYQVGGFVGWLWVRKVVFRNCYATGDVFASSFVPGGDLSYTGGFLGEGYGVFENCFATGDVTARRGGGGFVGMWSGGQSLNPKHYTEYEGYGNGEYNMFDVLTCGTYGCYATGDVYATDVNVRSSHSGGFVGYMDAFTVLTDAYSTGDVYGYSGVGGFVGTVNSAAIIDCYSTGKAIATAEGGAGGFVGSAVRPAYALVQFLNCVYDAEKSGISKAIGNDIGSLEGSEHIYGTPTTQPKLAEIRGLTTEQMNNKELIMSTNDTYSSGWATGGGNSPIVHHPSFIDATFPWAFEVQDSTSKVEDGYYPVWVLGDYDGNQYWDIDPSAESPIAFNRNNSKLFKQLLRFSASDDFVAVGGTETIILDGYVGEDGDDISWTAEGGAKIVGDNNARTVTVEGIENGAARINVYINGIKYDNIKMTVGTGGEQGIKAVFLSPAPLTPQSSHEVGIRPVFQVMFTHSIDQEAFEAIKKDDAPATLRPFGNALALAAYLSYEFSNNGQLLNITLNKDLSYGTQYTLRLNDDIMSTNKRYVTGGNSIDFYTMSFAAPKVTVSEGTAVVGGTQYTVSAAYKNEIPIGENAEYENAKVSFVVRAGLGARAASGGEMIFHAEKDLSLLSGANGSVDTTFTLPVGITGDFYVDVHTWSVDGSHITADTVNMSCEVK